MYDNGGLLADPFLPTLNQLIVTSTVPRLTSLASCLLFIQAAAVADEQLAFFETKIRPALVKHCYECHSSESDQIGGKLRLDSREGILTGGESGPALTAGDPENSLILQAIQHEGMEMPPEEKLPQQVANDFKKWIQSGALDPRTTTANPKKKSSAGSEDSQHTSPASVPWSFLPRREPAIPETENSTWARNSIDQFILSAMESNGAVPTFDADPRTLLRRMHYDLTGLPPSLEEIERFEQRYQQDQNEAIADVITEQLASPQFGIRWGRHWLDIARYGESNGDDGLGRNASFPHAWRYRNYVIESLNQDTPYDQFLIEQIAGDLLPHSDAEERNHHLTATGFLAIGSKPASAMNTNFAMDIVDDQINVIGTGVMGISVACARCHDHKHDPISTRDYYALAGIFSSTESLYGAAGNEKLTAPPTPLHQLTSKLPDPSLSKVDRDQPPELPPEFDQQIRELEPNNYSQLTTEPESLTTDSVKSFNDKTFAEVENASIKSQLAEGTKSYSVSFWFSNRLKNDARPITTYLFSRASWGDKSLPGDHLGIGGNHEAARTGKLFVFNGNEAKQTIGGNTVIPPNSWNHVTMIRENEQVKVFLNGRLEIDGSLPAKFGDSTEYCFATRSDQFAPLQGNLGHIAVFDRSLTQKESIDLHRSTGQPMGPEPVATVGQAMGVREKAKPANCKIHINGEGKKLGAEVPRGIPSLYLTAGDNVATNDPNANPTQSDDPKSPMDDSRIAGFVPGQSSGRLELAKWLTSSKHPQTSRVIANRIWMHLFGKGIVTTPNDFGVYGSKPTHPELLDHLADELIKNGWSIKQLIRKIVSSRTYQLDSRFAEATKKSDPANNWYTRHQRRRLDAESIRDSILLASGSLDLTGRAGSDIDQIDALINWPLGESSNLHQKTNRRSIYLCMLRHAPPKELAAFDLPDGVQVVGQRETTNLPTQALFFMNNDLVIEQAEILADQTMNPESPATGIDRLFVQILRRSPTATEQEQCVAILDSLRQELTGSITDPQRREKRTWTSLSQALMATNEFRYVD